MKKKLFLFLLIFLLIFTALGVGMYYSLPYRYENGSAYSVGNAELATQGLKTLRIHWPMGAVNVEAYDGKTISLKEENAPEHESQKLHFLQNDGVLHVHFCQSGTMLQGNAKQLILLIPKDFVCNLTIYTKSANLLLKGVSLRKVALQNATGMTRMHKTDVRELTCNTDSGAVNYRGKLQAGIFETKSGAHELFYEAQPEKLAFHSVDGTMNLTLPQKSTFRADFFTKDGSLSSAFAGKIEENRLIVGNDPDKIYEIITVSADLHINSK